MLQKMSSIKTCRALSSNNNIYFYDMDERRTFKCIYNIYIYLKLSYCKYVYVICSNKMKIFFVNVYAMRV